MHCLRINDIHNDVIHGDGPGGALALAKNGCHFTEHLALFKCRQRQTLTRLDLHGAGVDQIEIVALLANVKNHITLFVGCAHHIHHYLHRKPPCNRVTFISIYSTDASRPLE